MVDEPHSTEPQCPLCSANSSRHFEKHGQWIYQCLECEHLFALPTVAENHVAQVYSDEYFRGKAGGYADYLAEESAQRQAARFLLQQVSLFRLGRERTGTMLDVGCAAGFLLDEFQHAGWQVYGVEPNATMAAIAAERCKGGVECAAIEDWRTDRRFDLITCVQVISHLVDPGAVVRRLLDQLEPSGLLLIETWDRESRTARAMGKWWHEFNPPSELHWFTRHSLEQFITSCCPTSRSSIEMRAAGKPHKRISVGRSLNMLRHGTQSSAILKLATAPLALVPPTMQLPYPGDDAFWMIFQKTATE